MKSIRAGIGLTVLGLLQMAGDLAGIVPLKAVAAAWGASPAPKVFSAVRGLETYSTNFDLEWRDRAGTLRRMRLSPTVNARIRGPYNRRNVYGAAIAYAPVLPSGLRDPVMRYALCGHAPLLRELGVDPSTVAGGQAVQLSPRAGTSLGALSTRFEADCR